MRSIPNPSQNATLLASMGVFLLAVSDALPPLGKGLGVVALLALMFLGIAAEWRLSKDEVHKHAGKSAAAGAIPIALLLAFLSVLFVRFSPEASHFLVRVTEVSDGTQPARMFGLGVAVAFAWIVVVHFVLLALWWSRRT